MSATKMMLNPPLIGSILLGRFSAWLGMVVAPVYLALFVLATTQSAVDRPELAGFSLSILLPMVGLGLCAVGLGLAWLGRRAAPLGCVVGFLLNSMALLIASVLPWVVPVG